MSINSSSQGMNRHSQRCWRQAEGLGVLTLTGHEVLSIPEKRKLHGILLGNSSVLKRVWVGEGSTYVAGESEPLGRNGSKSSTLSLGRDPWPRGHAVLLTIPAPDLGKLLQDRNSSDL